MTDTFTAELVLAAQARAGESPWWSTREQRLYWVDIHGRALHRFDPATRRDEEWTMPDVVTFVATHARGGLVLALSDRIVHVDEPGATLRTVTTLAVPAGGRLNDGTIDPRGRLVIGAMCSADAPRGSADLYVVDLDGHCRTLLSGFRTVNGLAFAPDGRTLYVSDSHPAVRTLWRAAYDPDKGTCGRRSVFIDTRDLAGRPDGGCVDAEGAYWMAAVDGGAVLRFAADAKPLATVSVDTRKPSKAVFGASDLSTLFITSLGRGLAATDVHAGGLFAARPGVKGRPPPDCAIELGRGP